MKIDKLIVTNLAALKAKYGSQLGAIRKSLAALVAADATRGIRSRVAALDSATTMKRARAKPVTEASDEIAAKAAIDALCKTYAPDYLLIIGAPDVVPHIELNNPMNSNRLADDDDDDEVVPSDLPYASDAPFGRNARAFLGPTRVVGRLPDAQSSRDPALLLRLLATAAGHRTRPRKEYSGHFALSARVWVDSTELSASNLFGQGALVHTSPKEGPEWSQAQLAPRIHFINCHGNTASPTFSGEGPPETYFDAHRSPRLRRRVSEGAVVAAECCYGAELYDPEEADGVPGICSTYLAEGAYGFFGSTTIAYGPAEGNGQADLICQYFIDGVLKGASLGRAALEAQQRFIAQFSHHDPADLKTAAQFILLGDPSIHPVAAPTHSFTRTKAMAKGQASGLVHSGARAFRRERAARTGANLARSIGAAVPANLRTPAAVRTLLLGAARESGIRKPRIATYRVEFPAAARDIALAAVRESRRVRSIHLAIGTTGPGAGGKSRRVTAIIATLEGSRIVHLRRVHSR
jgi:hypothetical protein